MPIFELDGKRPRVHPDAYIAPTAVLIGDVRIAAGATVWFGAVLRGDESYIEVGEGSNVQDGCVVHCSEGLPTVIGRNSSLGHRACIEGCVVGDKALVGTGAIMLQRSRVGDGAVLAAGSVLLEGQEVPPGKLAAGSPATVKKDVSGSSAEWAFMPAVHYRAKGISYRKGLRQID
jgi:carbonic anhydrase/acetyltransferase-like protein (isoleucine patch superfamily)